MFNECLLLAVDDLYETPSFLWLPGVAGPKFDIKTKKVTAMIVEYESTAQFSFDYQKMDEFYQEVETWFQSLLSDAPPQLQNGFFISYLGTSSENLKFCRLTLFSKLHQTFEIKAATFKPRRVFF